MVAVCERHARKQHRQIVVPHGIPWFRMISSKHQPSSDISWYIYLYSSHLITQVVLDLGCFPGGWSEVPRSWWKSLGYRWYRWYSLMEADGSDLTAWKGKLLAGMQSWWKMVKVWLHITRYEFWRWNRMVGGLLWKYIRILSRWTALLLSSTPRQLLKIEQRMSSQVAW